MNIFTILWQHITSSTNRAGKLSLGYFVPQQMQQQGITLPMVEDAFRHGREVRSIIRRYADYSISLGYKWDEVKGEWVITRVRKFRTEA